MKFFRFFRTLVFSTSIATIAGSVLGSSEPVTTPVEIFKQFHFCSESGTEYEVSFEKGKDVLNVKFNVKTTPDGPYTPFSVIALPDLFINRVMNTFGFEDLQTIIEKLCAEDKTTHLKSRSIPEIVKYVDCYLNECDQFLAELNKKKTEAQIVKMKTLYVDSLKKVREELLKEPDDMTVYTLSLMLVNTINWFFDMKLADFSGIGDQM